MTHDEATIFLSEIFAQFPHPVSVDDPLRDEDDSCYCVGGALLTCARKTGYLPASGDDWTDISLSADDDTLFPSVNLLRDALCYLNPAQSYDQAQVYASTLANKNDLCRFEDARAIALRALTSGARE